MTVYLEYIICHKQIGPYDLYQRVNTENRKLIEFAHNKCVNEAVPDATIPDWLWR